MRSSRALLGPGVLVTVAVVAANGLNALFQFALARILDPGEYALLAALVVVTLIAMVPPVAFQASVAREMALHLAEGRRAEAGAALRGTVIALVLWGGVVLVLGGIAYPVLLPVGGEIPAAVLATAAAVAASIVVPAAWGGLQGAALFGSLSAANLFFSGARLAAGVAVGLAGGDAAAVMAAVAAATIVTAFLSLVPMRDLWRAAGQAASASARLATVPNAAAATGLTVLTALSSIDLLVARLAFDGDTAGAYAAASVGARVLLLLPIGVTIVLFPHVATMKDPVRERRHLIAGLAVVAGGSAVTVALLWGLAEPLVGLAFGSGYDDAASWLGPLSLAMGLYGLTNVYLYHFLSLGRTRFALVLVGLFAAQLVGFGIFHERPRDVIAVQLVVSALSVVAAEAWHLRRHQPRSDQPRGAPAGSE